MLTQRANDMSLLTRAASPRRRHAQRALVVASAATLLSLAAAAPALAGGLPNPVPTPSVLPKPVTQVVKTVTQTLGVPDPVASPAAKKHHHRHHLAPKQTLLGAHRSGTRTAHKSGSQHSAARGSAGFVTPATMPIGLMRGLTPTVRPMTVNGVAPALAAAPAAPTTKTTLIRPSAASMFPTPRVPGVSDRRTLTIIAGLLLVAIGATVHLRLVQQRWLLGLGTAIA